MQGLFGNYTKTHLQLGQVLWSESQPSAQPWQNKWFPPQSNCISCLPTSNSLMQIEHVIPRCELLAGNCLNFPIRSFVKPVKIFYLKKKTSKTTRHRLLKFIYFLGKTSAMVF